jgi:hypothetical protein
MGRVSFEMEESTFPHPDKHIQKFVEDAVNQGYRVEAPPTCASERPTFTRDDCQRHVVLRVWRTVHPPSCGRSRQQFLTDEALCKWRIEETLSKRAASFFILRIFGDIFIVL